MIWSVRNFRICRTDQYASIAFSACGGMLNSTRRSSRNWIVWRATSSSPSVFSHWIPPHGRLKPVSLLLILDCHLGMSNLFSIPFTFSNDLVQTIHAALHKEPASDGGKPVTRSPTFGPCGPDEQRSRHTRQSGEAAYSPGIFVSSIWVPGRGWPPVWAIRRSRTRQVVTPRSATPELTAAARTAMGTGGYGCRSLHPIPASHRAVRKPRENAHTPADLDGS
jgi:hypothetical protein